jgi:hypothetical protein
VWLVYSRRRGKASLAKENKWGDSPQEMGLTDGYMGWHRPYKKTSGEKVQYFTENHVKSLEGFKQRKRFSVRFWKV